MLNPTTPQKIIYPFSLRGQKHTCPVQIRKEKNKTLVTITEEDLTATNKLISDNFVPLALRIQEDLLPGTNFRDITWELHCVRDWMSDSFGYEVIYDVWIPKNLQESPGYVVKQVVAGYTIRKLTKTDTELVLGLGNPWDIKEYRLPLERFPSLSPFSREELKSYASCSKQGTVLYWSHLKEKLILRDAVLFGDGTQKMKEGDTDFRFQCEASPTTDPNRI